MNQKKGYRHEYLRSRDDRRLCGDCCFVPADDHENRDGDNAPARRYFELSGMSQNMMGVGGASIGWLVHFLIGTVLWGVLFALLYGRLPGSEPVRKGISFGILAWLLMMILPMPMAGAGFFGLALGMMAPVVTLILHVIWGAVLGIVFRMLPAEAVVQA